MTNYINFFSRERLRGRRQEDTHVAAGSDGIVHSFGQKRIYTIICKMPSEYPVSHARVFFVG